MTSPTCNQYTPNLERTAAPVRLPTPTELDLSKEEPEAYPKEQAQSVNAHGNFTAHRTIDTA